MYMGHMPLGAKTIFTDRIGAKCSASAMTRMKKATGSFKCWSDWSEVLCLNDDEDEEGC
jgi:hypothetical protein